MALDVSVKNVEPMTAAFLAMTGPFDQIPAAFGRLIGWIGSKGYAPAGPPFGIYYDDPAQVSSSDLKWELDFPINSQVSPEGPDAEGLGVKRFEGGLYAFAVHKGPYDEVGPVYGAVAAWTGENGYVIAGPPQEVYLSDPNSTPPDDLLTEIRFPVQKP